MTETPKCPYCGEEMTVMAVRLARHNWIGWCNCENCLSVGPSKSNCYTEEEAKEVAASAAIHRAATENRPLTLGEVQECCEKGIGYMPLWVEFRNTPNVSRWMPINLPDTVFSGETVSIYLKSIGDKYNAMWRCWHWKPTPEQMAAEKWEE